MLKDLFRRKVRDKNLVEGIFRKSLLVYILSDIAYASGPLVDGIVTGNYLGVDAVAAVSLVAPSIFIFNFALCILSAGTQSTFTELLGQGKVDEANSVFTLANVLGVISSLSIMLLILTFSHSIVRLLGAGAGTSLERYSADYLCGWSLGLAFAYCANIMNGFMNIDNDSSLSIFAIIAMTLTNIAGDIYVVLFTDAGIYGLALATSLSNVVYFTVLSLHFLRKNRILRLNFNIAKNFLANFLNICRQGSMSAFSRVSKSLAGIAINHIIISSAASYALAVYGVQNQMLSLFGSLYLGTADTVRIMSSVYYGEEDRKSLDDLQNTSMITGISLALIASVFMFMFSEFFAGLYLGHENPQVLMLGSESVRYLAFSLPLYVFIFGIVNYIQGIKRIFTANVFVLFIQLIIPVSIIYVTVKVLGAGAWLSTPYSALILALLCVGYVVSQKIPSKTPVEFKKRLLLTPNFYDDDGHELDLAADSELEVIGMSRISRLFCLENNFSERIALRLSLCIEELGMNIIEHGFNDGKPHYIYLRILARKDKIILRIRDDCVPFNPLEYYEMTSQKEDDPTKNIGIRMVMKMCSDVIYLSMFRTNNLIITIPKEGTDSRAQYKFVNHSILTV